MKQKLLFLVFTDDACRQNHAFMYALECHALGHKVRLILEGPATACLNRLAEGGNFSQLFKRAKDSGLLEGACKTASGGCSTNEKDRDVAKIAGKEGLRLISDLDGHAGIGRFVESGYQIMIF
ncbi:MAG: hypothetical protein A2X34_09795 [Elusimicrobia bacterium GWC2_51_8]|nr:MAG: hypothetical protein A2X33_01950 [Elusimicrobia bacterium GWA2_51_34]OGR61443.1 MAG: hypothetical protein A2X34_09795 [Elusimicrobia bacterium GWC2_51_8]OGR85126.1 MAG: hypothetical protein A2021_09360 [Elusimicrobia bacterium GWF2_52_66]HAF94535.1 hypothetical protein [Elusimicrobiota bacterium]HCE97899.1 hypothetical protein [Elusimicrobiota bacterium]